LPRTTDEAEFLRPAAEAVSYSRNLMHSGVALLVDRLNCESQPKEKPALQGRLNM